MNKNIDQPYTPMTYNKNLNNIIIISLGIIWIYILKLIYIKYDDDLPYYNYLFFIIGFIPFIFLFSNYNNDPLVYLGPDYNICSSNNLTEKEKAKNIIGKVDYKCQNSNFSYLLDNTQNIFNDTTIICFIYIFVCNKK